MKIFIFSACLLVIFLGLFLDVHAKYNEKQTQNYKKEIENCNKTMQQQQNKMSQDDIDKETWKCALEKIGAVVKGKIQVHKLIRTCTWSMNSDYKEDLCYKLAVSCICEAYQGKTDEEKLDILAKCGMKNGLVPLLTVEGS